MLSPVSRLPWETRRVRKGLTPDDLGDLLDLPLVAVLATYRRDGTVLLSPVWHEWRDNGFNVVTGSSDGKAGHLRRDPRASIVVCDDSPPYRGIELRTRARLSTLNDCSIVRRIATHYLGRYGHCTGAVDPPSPTVSGALPTSRGIRPVIGPPLAEEAGVTSV
jgi:PPOX class probable F420-dependent enzyme